MEFLIIVCAIMGMIWCFNFGYTLGYEKGCEKGEVVIPEIDKLIAAVSKNNCECGKSSCE